MSKNPVPVQQLFQALSSGRLFWIDSALNQSQVGTRCPYLCGALYLYLFNLRLVDSIKPYIDEPMIARLDAVLCRVPTDTSASQCHHDDAQLPPSDQDANAFEYGEPSSSGEKLFLLMVDAFENAYHLVSDGSGFFTQGSDFEASLRQYFALRLKLHLNLSAPEDLPVSDKMTGLNEGFTFCALAFHLSKKNDQHLTAKIESLHQVFRLNGHVSWLQFLIAKNNNRLDHAKAHWLNASFLPSFDHNLAEERGLLFGEDVDLNGLSGLRLLKNTSQYRCQPVSVDETKLEIGGLGHIRESLELRKSGEKKYFEARVKNEITTHRNKKRYINLSVNDVDYVSPEDFLRTFVFTFPSVDTLQVSMALSGVLQQIYIYENLAKLVSQSLSKLDSRWTQTRDLQIVRDHADFIRRIWRSYESGVYQVPPLKPVISLYSDLEHWDFIRQVWPKAKRLLVVPSGNIDGLINDLDIQIDAETETFSLASRWDARRLLHRLALNSVHFEKCRDRWLGWHRLFGPGL